MTIRSIRSLAYRFARYVVVGACVVLSGVQSAQGQPITPLYEFLPGGHPADGVSPWAGVVQDSAGNVYGTTYQGGGSPNCVGGCGTIYKVTPAGVEVILHVFAGNAAVPSEGQLPFSGLVLDSAGNLFGTTLQGGGKGGAVCNNVGCGTVFEYSAAGVFTTLHAFAGGINDGMSPYGGLLLSGTNLYGTTYTGGANSDPTIPTGYGTFYKTAIVGGATVLMHSFALLDGIRPQGGLIQDAVGNFYGPASQGGTNNDGTLWEYAPAAHPPFSVLHNFNHNAPAFEGSNPIPTLNMDGAGNLFGVTAGGGTTAIGVCSFNQVIGCGTVFEFTPGNAGVVNLHSFSGLDGFFPVAQMVRDCQGVLYGGTFLGGANFVQPNGANTDGTMFSLTPPANGVGPYAFTKLLDFTYNGLNPGDAVNGGLCQDTDSNILGTAVYGANGVNPGAGLVFQLPLPPALFKDLHSLAGPVDGSDPVAGLVQDSQGNFYGTTKTGGAHGLGTLFKLTPPLFGGGAYGFAVLHNFAGGAGDGATPTSNLVIANGTVFGTTTAGGAFGNGTIFKFPIPGGPYAPLVYSFKVGDGTGASGLATDGFNLYGSQSAGGGAACAGAGCGTIYSFDPAGLIFKILYNFNAGGSVGSFPVGVTLDTLGNIYGSTQKGGAGAGCPAAGCGIVYELPTPAFPEVVIHVFAKAAGQTPNGPLAFDQAAQLLYGTTQAGGAPNLGIVYKVSTAAGFVFNVIHVFVGGADGAIPLAGVIRNRDGSLYGTTSSGGGDGNDGTVFKVDAHLVTSTLYQFGLDEQPAASLFQDRCGYLYGTTQAGGTIFGEIFSLRP